MPPLEPRQGISDEFHISMVLQFIMENEDKLVTVLTYYFPDCDFEIEHRTISRNFWGKHRQLVDTILIMEWGMKKIDTKSRDPPPYENNKSNKNI